MATWVAAILANTLQLYSKATLTPSTGDVGMSLGPSSVLVDVGDPGRSDWEWGLGICLCLAGAAGTNLGLTIQKLSFIRNDASEIHEQRSAMRQPLWITGLTVFLTGQILNLIAFGYTGQALAATLGSFSLVTNGFFAPLLLGEELTRTIVISIIVIVSGSILVVFSSSRATQDYTLQSWYRQNNSYNIPSHLIPIAAVDNETHSFSFYCFLLLELVALYQRDLFIVYMSILIMAFTLCLILMYREQRRWSAANQKLSDWEKTRIGEAALYEPTVPSASNGNGDADDTLVLDPEMNGTNLEIRAVRKKGDGTSEKDALIGERRVSPPPELKVVPPTPVTPIVAGAILSSLSVLFGKCSVQLVKSSVSGENEFIHPLSWFITIVFLVCAILAVVFLNLGLHRGTALFVVPLYYVLNTVLAILGGLIYFEEFQRFTFVQGLTFGSGVLVTVIGVWVGSRGQVSDDDEIELSTGSESESPTSLSASPEEEEKSISPPVTINGAGQDKSRSSSIKSFVGDEVGAAAAPPRKRSSLTSSNRRNGEDIIPVGGTKVVRFGGVTNETASMVAKEQAKAASSTVSSPSSSASSAPPSVRPLRLFRASSTSDVGLTDEEFESLLAEQDAADDEARARMTSSFASSNASAQRSGVGSLRLHPALSTPQPSTAVTRYGSLDDATMQYPLITSRTPDHRPSHHRPSSSSSSSALLARSHHLRRPRSIDMSKLTPSQQLILKKRLANRYTYDQLAYQSSFPHPSHLQGKRKYSVAVLGLGVS